MKTKKKELFWVLAAFAVILSGLTGCIVLSGEEVATPTRITDPSMLPDNLAHQRVLFRTHQNEEVIVNITTLDRENSKVIKLLHEGWFVTLSPDGQHLAYGLSNGIWITGVQTGTTEILVNGADQFPEVSYLSLPDFSPNGEKLVFSMMLDTTDEVDLATIYLDGSNFRRFHLEGLNDDPKYSHDGKSILSICEGDGVVGFQICIMDSDGQGRKRLTNTEGYHWAWFAPKGGKIVFSRLQTRLLRKDLAGLYVMNMDGTNVTPLVEWYTSVLAFDVGGSEVVFCKIHQEGGCEGIYVINLDGTNLRHLVYFDEEFLSKWH